MKHGMHTHTFIATFYFDTALDNIRGTLSWNINQTQRKDALTLNSDTTCRDKHFEYSKACCET